VAAQRLTFPRPCIPGGRPGDDDRLQADVAAGLEPGVTPLTNYLRARTAWVDGVLLGALEEGIDQVVLAGAGYDGRGLRYARAGVRFFELDHPETQADKLGRLARLGIDTSGVGFAAVDFLTGDLPAALAGVDHDPGRPTLSICEGVAEYLPVEVLGSLLGGLSAACPRGSRLAVTLALVPVTGAGRASRARLRAVVASMGEDLTSEIPREDLAGFLARSGWVAETAVDPAGRDLTRSDGNSAFVLARSGL
jgi:methyltransferase (TIGR00027 family)